jgi:hypothetical protein
MIRSVPNDPRRETPKELPQRTCPHCGTASTEHPAGECLDRWVHAEFLRKSVASDEAVPPYSRSPRHSCLNDLIRARRWAEGTAVMQTIAGCSVGILTRKESGYEHYQIVATAQSLPLAICRAAICGVASSGTKSLRIT